MANSKNVNLKQRGPVAWTLISLLVPFGLLAWLHKSRRQIDFLNSESGRPQRLMNPWWVTGTVLTVIISVVLLTVVMFAVGGWWSDPPTTPESSTESSSALFDAELVLNTDEAGQFESLALVDPTDGDVLTTDDVLNSTNGDDELTGREVAVGIVAVGIWTIVGFAPFVYLIAFILYLVKHVDGIVALAGTNEDKTMLLVMGILGAVVFWPLVVFVVYKSQEIINQALSARGQTNPGTPPVAS